MRRRTDQRIEDAVRELAPKKGRWERVKFASHLPKCPVCREEPWCGRHKMHFSECACIGPTEDHTEYRESPKGILMGRRIG